MINIDFNLSFTIVAAGVTAFLGFLVIFHDRKSVTNVIFLTHALIGTIWAIVNYISLAIDPEDTLIWIRFVIFLAVPHVFLFFLFVRNFPATNLKISLRELSFVLGVMSFNMLLAASPYAFSNISIDSSTGAVTPTPGILIPLFGGIMVIFFLFTVGLVVKKFLVSTNLVRRQWFSIGLGLISAYSLLILLVLLRVIAQGDTTFVLYSPLFLLPIFVGAAYAILRHHLFNVKVITTEIFTFLLILASFVMVLIAEGTIARSLAAMTTILVVIFGISLIRSVLREVRQREELQKLTEELKAANTELEKLSQFKTQLLSLASHQVKSPLAAIKGFAQLLIQGLYGPLTDKVKETIQKMMRASDDLIVLINTLLDFRKVEEGRMEYTFAETKLNDIVKGVISELEVVAGQKNLKLSYKESGEVLVNADATKLKQVVQNLVDNAIKYTPEGAVAVELQDEGAQGTALISIKDTGLGMSQELIPHLFDEFIRDERVKKEIKGTGLGLYIARKMIEAHGGKVWAESRGENKGSIFYVRLKKA